MIVQPIDSIYNNTDEKLDNADKMKTIHRILQRRIINVIMRPEEGGQIIGLNEQGRVISSRIRRSARSRLRSCKKHLSQYACQL